MTLSPHPDFIDPTGHVVRLVFVSVNGRELCEELEWFYGGNTLKAAQEYRDRCLTTECLDDLTEGTYRLTIHEAYEKGDDRWFEDSPIERVVFRIKRPVSVEVIER